MPFSPKAVMAMNRLRVSLQQPSSSHHMLQQPTSSSIPNDTNPKTSLLDLPYEIRAHILQYVLKAQPFLSSRQQISAMGSSDPVSPSTPESYLTPREENFSQTSKWKSKPKPCPFTRPSVTFKSYAESRHADTSVLYVCHQLRNEGLPLLYQYRYYLTLVLEIPLIAFPPTPVLHYDAGSVDSVRRFWEQISKELRFPSLKAMKRFKKGFHVSLYWEDVAFRGLLVSQTRAGEGVGGIGEGEIADTRLSKEETLGILLRDDVDDGSSIIEGVDGFGRQDLEKVKFEDSTFLDVVKPGSEDEGSKQVVMEEELGVGQEEARISFSIDLWRI